MLRIGLTGGIGAGKSAVSSIFSRCGGVVVDGDVLAREVVQPGTEGLAALVAEFGEDILRSDGELDRQALAAKAFRDDAARVTLNGIIHPLVARRRSEIIAAVVGDAVIVEDIPLLVESGLAPLFPLVVVVHADVEVRVHRLVQHRGMTEADARARIAAQANDTQRHAVADVWLDNSGSPGELAERATELWNDRIQPFADNLAHRRIAQAPVRLVPADATWPEQAQRIIARLKTACGHRALRIDHIGSTAVPALDAKDVIDIQITVASLAVADELTDALRSVGYPRLDHITGDMAKTDARSTGWGRANNDDIALWQKRFHASSDPGRPTNVHIRVQDWPNQQFALLFVDWLAANADARADYLAIKRTAEKLGSGELRHYADAKEPWFLDAYRRAWCWADAVGWRPN